MSWKLIRQEALDSALAGVGDLEKRKEKLQDQLTELQHTVKRLKLDKKIEMEDVEHMMRIKDGKREVEYANKEAELRAELAKELQAEQNKYSTKVANMLEISRVEMKEMYSEVLDRLPKVDVNIKRK